MLGILQNRLKKNVFIFYFFQTKIYYVKKETQEKTYVFQWVCLGWCCLVHLEKRMRWNWTAGWIEEKENEVQREKERLGTVRAFWV